MITSGGRTNDDEIADLLHLYPHTLKLHEQLSATNLPARDVIELQDIAD